jgi:hypothetical protein
MGAVTDEMRRAYPNTSGTASAYIDFAYSINRSDQSLRPSVQFIFKDVIAFKAHKVEIPEKLNLLYAGLGDTFSLVHDNVDKAKTRVMTVKQAVSDMRDVLNQIWANLADRSLIKYPKKRKGMDNKEFKSPVHRKIVCESLVKYPENTEKFELLLETMYKLYGEMSETYIGKNPSSQDYPKLDEFYTRWIALIDGVIAMIDWD